jgi:hypothetical protein
VVGAHCVLYFEGGDGCLVMVIGGGVIFVHASSKVVVMVGNHCALWFIGGGVGVRSCSVGPAFRAITGKGEGILTHPKNEDNERQ